MDVLETSRSMGVLVRAVSVIGHRCLGHRRRGVVRGGGGTLRSLRCWPEQQAAVIFSQSLFLSDPHPGSDHSNLQ